MAGFSPVCPRHKLGLPRRGSINIENRYYRLFDITILPLFWSLSRHLFVNGHPLTLILYYHAHYEDERVAR